MFKKMFYFILVCLMYSHFYIPSPVHASPQNVMDCMEEGVNCEDLGIQEDNQSGQDEGLTKESNNVGSLFLQIIQLFFALLLVLALIYIVLKFLNKRNKITTQGQFLENIGGISLGQNKSLQMVRIGTKVYLIGVGENVELLEEISDEEVKKELLDNVNTTSNGTDTKTFISSLIPSKTNHVKKKDFKHLFSNELEKLKENRNELIKKQKEDKHE